MGGCVKRLTFVVNSVQSGLSLFLPRCYFVFKSLMEMLYSHSVKIRKRLRK